MNTLHIFLTPPSRQVAARFGSVACLLLLFFIRAVAQAQPNIRLADDFPARADEYKVKMKIQTFGKIGKYRFGPYGVVDSRATGRSETTKSNFWGTRSKTSSQQSFSFELSSDTGGSLTVMAETYHTEEESRSFQLIDLGGVHVSTGLDELTRDEELLLAVIKPAGQQQPEPWILQVLHNLGDDRIYSSEGTLRCGTRQIAVTQVSSFTPGEIAAAKSGRMPLKIPALGYEFTENGRLLAAVQYMGGGLLGQNKKIVWLGRDLDPGLRPVLAAAMTTLLAWKANPDME